MSPLPEGVRRVFRLAIRRPSIEQDVKDEVAFHLEMRAAELVARGLSPDEARAEATRRFGNPAHWSTAMREEDRDRVAQERRAEWFGDLAQDLRFAVRSFGRAPLFSALAVLTLALGIGANAAVFGVVKSVLLNPLPYQEPERVVRIYGRLVDGSAERAPTSAGVIADLREQGGAFTGVAGILSIPQEGVLMADGLPRLVKIARTEPELFATLGVQPDAGRVLQAEDAAGDTAYSAVLTHGGWQRLLGGAADPVGQKVTVNGIPRTVVGVLPPGFVGPIGDVDLYLPMSLRGYLGNVISARMRQNFAVVGRLKPGVTMEAANRDVVAVMDDARKRFPRETGNFGLNVVGMQDALVGDTRTPLLVLMGKRGARAAHHLREPGRRAPLAHDLAPQGVRDPGRAGRRPGAACAAAAHREHPAGAGRRRRGRGAGVGRAGVAPRARRARAAGVRAADARSRGTARHGARRARDRAPVRRGAGALGGACGSAAHAPRRDARGEREPTLASAARGARGRADRPVRQPARGRRPARAQPDRMSSAPLGFQTSGLLTATVFVPNQRYAAAEARAGFYQALEERLRAIPA
jgi:hypothetical protein